MSFPDSNDAPVSQQSSARRRLLRGVVGAAVLPVGAGAQAAVASNLRCIANTVDPAAEPPSAAGGRSADKLAADNVTRVPLYKSTNTISGKLYVRYWVKGSDLVALKNTAVVGLPSGVTGANYLLSSSTYVATSSPPGTDLMGSVSSTPQSYNGLGWSALAQDATGADRYVAVRFDGAGNMVGTSDYVSSFASPVNNSAIKTGLGATSGFDLTVNSVISGSADLMFAAGASNAFFESWMFSVGNLTSLMFWVPVAGVVARWAWRPVIVRESVMSAGARPDYRYGRLQPQLGRE